MKALVTGARGFVGARVMAALDDAVPAPSLQGLSEDDVRRIVDAAGPDVIFHTAAISDIPTCERNPEASRHANVEIPVWLARTGVKLVAFSTDQVYSGCETAGPYTEEFVKPANLYAVHKLEMEQRTLECNPATVLLRATWMYDMPMYGVSNRGNFLVNMLRERELANGSFLFPPRSSVPSPMCGRLPSRSKRRHSSRAAHTTSAAKMSSACWTLPDGSGQSLISRSS